MPKDHKGNAIALGLSRYERFRDFSNNKPDRDCLDKEQIE